MSSDSTLAKAAEKAAGELVAANGVYAKGASFAESTEKLKDGSADFQQEFVAKIGREGAANDIVYVKFDQENRLTAFRLSTCGQLMTPIMDDIRGELGMADNMPKVDVEEIKKRQQVAKDGVKSSLWIRDPIRELRTTIGYPRSSEPRIDGAVKGDLGIAAWSAVVTLGLMYYFKKDKR